MKPLPLPARILAGIADRLEGRIVKAGGRYLLLLVYLASVVGGLVLLSGRVFGTTVSHGLFVAAGLACWVVLLALMKDTALETGAAGPALTLAGFWLSGAGVVVALFDPRASRGTLAFDVGTAAVLAVLCYGRWVLLVRSGDRGRRDPGL